jgi:putative peptidoglycan lipid II flippase
MITYTGLGASATVYFCRQKLQSGEMEASKKFGGIIVTITAISVLGATLIGLLANQFVQLSAPGLEFGVHQHAVKCLEISSLSLPFVTVFSFLNGLLQADKRFYATGLGSSIFVGFVPIPILVWEASPEFLAWGYDLSAALGCMFLLAMAYLGKLVRLGKVSFPELKETVLLAAPAFTAASLTHSVWFLERTFASSLPAGGISALNYGQRIVNFVANGMTFATSTTLLSYLSTWLAKGDKDQAGAFNRQVMAWTTVLALIGTCGIFIFGESLIRLVFARGHFDESAIELTTIAARLYLGTFVAYLFTVVLGRNALAVNEGTVMIRSGVAFLSTYLLIAPLLQQMLSMRGLAMAASAASVFSGIFYFWGMYKKYPYLYVDVGKAVTKQSAVEVLR